MYQGEWQENRLYQRGNIIYTRPVKYYICSIGHQSNNLTYPSVDDIYWIHVDEKFLDSITFAVNVLPGTGVEEYNEPKNNLSRLVFDLLGEEVPESSFTQKKQQLQVISDEEVEKKALHKRKIRSVEKEIRDFKRQKLSDDIDNMKDSILLMNMDVPTKTFILDKYENTMKMHGSDYSKGMNWLKTVMAIPFGKYKPLKVKVSDTEEKINTFFKTVKEKLDKNIHGLEEVKQEIMEYVARKISNPNGKGHVLALCGSAGTGKCFAKDTKVLMYDGKIKKVQDVIVGDTLMGDDSTPRKVLALGKGRDVMYKIQHVKGQEYTVNSEHILCLKYTRKKSLTDEKLRNRYTVSWFDNKAYKKQSKVFTYNNDSKAMKEKEAIDYFNKIIENQFCEIKVTDYLQLSKTLKMDLKGYSTKVDFQFQDIDFDPYILGFWLGDGSKNDTTITTQDATVIHYLKNNLSVYGCYLQHSALYNYRVNGTNNKNKMLNALRKYKLINNKHIPEEYKCNSYHVRLNVLAGLIDSDGSFNKGNMFEITQSYEKKKLVEDIVFLARSLGFQCTTTIKNTSWTHKGIKKIGKAYRMYISGEGLENIPVKVPRKKARKRMQIKDALSSGITVTEMGYDDYYGFMIDGNERFVLGNFVVTHNTKIIHSLAEALNMPLFQINCGGLNDASVLTGHSETYVGSKPGKIVEFLQSSKYMNPIIYLDEIDKISEHRAVEINGILTHMLDEEQNTNFQDNYLSNVPLDLSKVLFVLAFNDITKIDSIVLDRLKVIHIGKPSLEDKVMICQSKVIPEIIKNIKFKETKKTSTTIEIEKETIEYIILHKIEKESGIRQLKKVLEQILNKTNFDILTGNVKNLYPETNKNNVVYKITRKYVDESVKNTQDTFSSYSMMYI